MTTIRSIIVFTITIQRVTLINPRTITCSRIQHQTWQQLFLSLQILHQQISKAQPCNIQGRVSAAAFLKSNWRTQSLITWWPRKQQRQQARDLTLTVNNSRAKCLQTRWLHKTHLSIGHCSHSSKARVSLFVQVWQPKDFNIFLGSMFTVDERFQFIKRIGFGAYGVVCAAKDSETKTEVAIKKIPKAF